MLNNKHQNVISYFPVNELSMRKVCVFWPKNSANAYEQYKHSCMANICEKNYEKI